MFLADRTNGRTYATVLHLSVVCRLSVCNILYRGPVHSLFAPRMYINILRTLVGKQQGGKQTFLHSVIGNRTSQCVKC